LGIRTGLIRRLCRLGITAGLCAAVGCAAAHGPGLGATSGTFDVCQFGARGDGTTLDTGAVNAAIAAAHAAGGGTVVFPAGVYACHSVHLQSNVALYLQQGATLSAAPPADAGSDGPSYDPPEPNPFDRYQDFGHSHFHNSLIWGEDLVNVAILGPGTIDGSQGLSRGSDADADPAQSGAGVGNAPVPRYTGPKHEGNTVYPNARDTLRAGVGNKAISLKLCRNVILRDFTIRGGGHFAILATGVDNLTIDDLKIDTNRDGMDVDSCRNVRIANCTVNSPWDDGICLKCDYALGYPRACEDVTITNCQVSGWVCGSLLTGQYGPFTPENDGGGGGTGRIKLGTESNGGFKNIAISNCVFDTCRGIALETVDGGRLEDVAIDNITMRHPVNSPIFLRLGARLRGPRDTTEVGQLQRVSINNLVVYDADPRYASVISGIPGHAVRDVKVSNVQIFSHGGGAELTHDWATTRPLEREDRYPEPAMFGPTGAYGFYVRHVDGIEFNNVALHAANDDLRPAFVLDDVDGAKFVDVDAEQTQGVPPLMGTDARHVTVRDFPGADASPPAPPTSQPATQP
jgi:polygalacturonase